MFFINPYFLLYFQKMDILWNIHWNMASYDYHQRLDKD